MSPSLKLGVYIFVGVVAAWIALHILISLVHTLLGLIVPIAVVVGIGYVVYALFGRKALGSGGRRYLP